MSTIQACSRFRAAASQQDYAGEVKLTGIPTGMAVPDIAKICHSIELAFAEKSVMNTPPIWNWMQDNKGWTLTIHSETPLRVSDVLMTANPIVASAVEEFLHCQSQKPRLALAV